MNEKSLPTLAEDVARLRERARNANGMTLDDALALQRVLDAIETINTPAIDDFFAAVEREAKHQRLRWGTEHDTAKSDADWYWLIGWLAGKAVHASDASKRLHHIITTAAACFNWHATRVDQTTEPLLVADRTGAKHEPSEMLRELFRSSSRTNEIAEQLDAMADRSNDATAEFLHDAADVLRAIKGTEKGAEA